MAVQKSQDANDPISTYIEQLLPGSKVESVVLIEADDGCGIVLDNPDGGEGTGRVPIPAGEHSARLARLPPQFGGARWILLVLETLPNAIIRGRTEEQWLNLWERRDDFDFKTPNGDDYFA